MSPRLGAILILITSCLLFFAAIGQRDFWAPDEGDFALIAHELKNDIVVPHLNSEPYAEKPPLFYYLTALSVKSFPFLTEETSMRIPSALFATAFALLFYWLLLSVFPLKQVLLSSLILLSTPLYYWQARYLQVDMVFATLVSASLLTFFCSMARQKPIFLYLASAFLALSFLVKGPLAIALVLPPAFLFACITGNRSIITIKRLLIATILVIIIVLPWYIAIYAKEGYSFLYENVIRQNLTRFFDAWSHRRPFYYYFTTLPLDAFPWIIFFPVGLIHSIRTYRTSKNVLFFTIWFVWIFLFLSLSSGKISKYMLPLIPPLSLLASHLFFHDNSRYQRIATAILAIVFCALGVTLLVYPPPQDYTIFCAQGLTIGILSLVCSAALFTIIVKKIPNFTFPVIFLFLVALFTIANISIFPKMNIFKSPRPITTLMKPYLAEGSPWVYYGSIRGVYVYYAGRQAIHIDEHDTTSLGHLPLKEKRFYLLTRKRDLEEVQKTLPGIEIIFEKKIGDTPMTFVRFTASNPEKP